MYFKKIDSRKSGISVMAKANYDIVNVVGNYIQFNYVPTIIAFVA